MTALSADKDVLSKGAGLKLSFPLEADAVIYKGSIVILNADGYAEPASALASNVGLAGVAVHGADNTGGSNGDVSVEVFTRGVFLFAKASAAQTDVGLELYAGDDATAVAEAANLAKLGQVKGVVGTTQAWIDIAEGVIHPEIGS